MTEWINRTLALATLRVRPQTLYAYVSRGRIGARPDPDDARRSLYRADDIAALVKRRARGRRHGAIAASAIAWGEPSITTTISTIRHGALIYRGDDAVRLSESTTLEDVARLLWEEQEKIAFVVGDLDIEDDLFVALARLIAKASHSLGRRPENLRRDAAGVVGTLAVAIGAIGGEEPVHERLARGWSLHAEGSDMVRRILVLMADHELNASTFAVRVAASTGASIAASLLAGLSALSGPRHGSASERMIELVEDAVRLGAGQAVGRWLAREQRLPGFDHPLYPDGDPRARALLDRFAVDPLLAELRDVVAEATGTLPNVDFALAAITNALRLPRETAFRLFALGRSVGWAAHAMEQAASGQLIRPRAVYGGSIPVAQP